MHSTNTILLVKPANFGYNTETAASNAFQQTTSADSKAIAQQAIQEFEQMAQRLSDKGINVTIVEDTPLPIKPDAIFPNNWGSFHTDGTVVLYPMLAPNRQAEKRPALLEVIRQKFHLQRLVDLSPYEQEGIFLEGTGSIVFDHASKIAYACLSPRTHPELFRDTCTQLGYTPIAFRAVDTAGQDIYHTNVMMNVGNGYAAICLKSIPIAAERQLVISTLKQSGKELIDLSYAQIEAFCGNMLELSRPTQKNILALSTSAFEGLLPAQQKCLENYCELLPLHIPTIERIGGGSVRCMISEIFLPLKTTSAR